MIFCDEVPPDFELRPEFVRQCGFVQFHPSYDYTDFVEGLRPIAKDGSAEIGFERKDGVFKECCKNALINLLESRKSKEEIQMDVALGECLTDFLNEAIEQKLQLKIKSGNEYFVENQDEKKVYISIPQNDKVKSLTIMRKEFLAVLNYEGAIKSVKDVWKNILKRNLATQQDSYIYAIFLEVREAKKKSVRRRQEASTSVSIKPFIFIIDEINRGEASKIFGELFFAIDPGYRGVRGRIKTQYQNLIEDADEFKEGFFVPENVYIIGTMNDIDRSVETMDFAFRRRFAWKEIKPGERLEMLDSLLADGMLPSIVEEAKAKMDALNKEIVDHPELNESYQIGAAYFMRIKDYGGDFVKLWDYHLCGLLTEYLRGTESEGAIIKFKEAYERAGKFGVDAES